MPETSDLYLTSALRVLGHRTSRTVSDGRRTTWVFDSTPELDMHLRGYFDGTLLVSAKDFASTVRVAKSEAVQMSAIA